MRIKYVILFLFIFLSLSSNAQIQGSVLDSATNEGVSEVEVIDVNSDVSTTTDKNGFFELNTINSTEAKLIFYKEGYKFGSMEIDTVKTFYSFSIEKLQVELSEIEITRKRKEIFATRKLKDIEGITINAGKKTEVVVLDLIDGNLAANVSRHVFAQISGLNIYEGSDGGLQLNIGGRGLDPNRTSNFNTRQNGYDISADVLGYPENYYTPPAESLEEIRIIRGASSLQYGTQFGGLIDFKIRKIAKYRKWDIRSKQSYGSFNFFNSFQSLGYNGGKWSINAFYNYKQGDGFRPNSEFDAHNAFVATSFDLGKNTKLDLEYTYYNYLAKQAGGLTDLQFASSPRISTRDRNWFRVNWHLYNVKFHHSFRKSDKLVLNLFGLNAQRESVGYRGDPSVLNQNPITSLDEQDSNGNYINPRDLILGQFRNGGAELRYLNAYELRNIKGTYLVGAKYFNSNNTSEQGPGTTGVDPDFSLQTASFPDYANQSDFNFPNLNFAAFAENVFYFGDKLSVTPGLRFEHITTKSSGQYQELIFDLAGNAIANNTLEEQDTLSRSFLLSGLGIDYTVSEKLKYSINISQNYRSVTFSDIRVVSPSFIVDENIRDESGYSFNAGVSGRIKSRFSYDFNIYSLFYNDRIGIILDDRANRKRTNIGDVFITGTESLLSYIPINIIRNNKRLFQLRTFLNSSFTYSKYLNSLSNNVVGNKVEFIPTVNIKSGLTAAYKDLRFSIRHSYISQQFSDAQNSVADEDGGFRNGIIGEIPAYQIFDLSLSYSWKNFKIDAGVNNFLNESYFTRRATGYPGPGIIPSEGRSFYITANYTFLK